LASSKATVFTRSNYDWNGICSPIIGNGPVTNWLTDACAIEYSQRQVTTTSAAHESGTLKLSILTVRVFPDWAAFDDCSSSQLSAEEVAKKSMSHLSALLSIKESRSHAARPAMIVRAKN